MSLSPESRKADAARLVTAVMEALGDGFYREFDIEPDHQDWNHFHRTTWKDLLDQGVLQHEPTFPGPGIYQLSSFGWLHGLKRTGADRTPQFQERVSRLLAALKQLLGPRPDDVLANYREIVAASGLPETWVLCAIDSNMLYLRDPSRSYWLESKQGHDVVIPVNFGLEDLRS